MVTLKEYQDLTEDRPEKFTAGEVGYEPAPKGSAFRCGSCFHLYRRSPDNFQVCEIFRDDSADEEGIDSSYRCAFWTAPDGEGHPLLPEEES